MTGGWVGEGRSTTIAKTQRLSMDKALCMVTATAAAVVVVVLFVVVVVV